MMNQFLALLISINSSFIIIKPYKTIHFIDFVGRQNLNIERMVVERDRTGKKTKVNVDWLTLSICSFCSRRRKLRIKERALDGWKISTQQVAADSISFLRTIRSN